MATFVVRRSRFAPERNAVRPIAMGYSAVTMDAEILALIAPDPRMSVLKVFASAFQPVRTRSAVMMVAVEAAASARGARSAMSGASVLSRLEPRL